MKLITLLTFLLYGCSGYTVTIGQSESPPNFTTNTTEGFATTLFVEPSAATFWFDKAIGISYLVQAIIVTSLYVPCLIVIYRQCRDPTQSSSCYQLMFVMGIADLFQVLALGYAAGVMSVCFANIPGSVSKFWGAVASAAGQIYSALLLLIAFNRYLCVCRGKHLEDRLFGPILTKRWLAAVAAYSMGYFSLCLSPAVGFHYHRLYNSYHWGPERWTDMTVLWNGVINLAVGVFGSIFYAKIMLHIRAQKNAVAGEAALDSMQQMERNSLKTFVLIFGSFNSGVIYWFAVAPFLQQNTNLSMYVGHMIWYTNASINPFIYLTINKTIKEGVLELFRKKPRTGVNNNSRTAF